MKPNHLIAIAVVVLGVVALALFATSKNEARQTEASAAAQQSASNGAQSSDSNPAAASQAAIRSEVSSATNSEETLLHCKSDTPANDGSVLEMETFLDGSKHRNVTVFAMSPDGKKGRRLWEGVLTLDSNTGLWMSYFAPPNDRVVSSTLVLQADEKSWSMKINVPQADNSVSERFVGGSCSSEPPLGMSSAKFSPTAENPAPAPTGTPSLHPVERHEQFRYAIVSNGYRADTLCDEIQSFGKKRLCYAYGWKPWLKEIEQRTVGNDTGKVRADSQAQIPGNLVFAWDRQERVVFSGCRPHDCPTANAYFIVSASTRELDVIWRNESGVRYLGPNSDFLRTNSAYELLETLSKKL